MTSSNKSFVRYATLMAGNPRLETRERFVFEDFCNDKAGPGTLAGASGAGAFDARLFRQGGRISPAPTQTRKL